MQSLTADTAGYISFEKADKDNKLYLVKTQIRAERFLKGKLKITSPVRWEVFIDGASKQVKDAAEDSITSGSSRDIALSLEPESGTPFIIYNKYVSPVVHKSNSWIYDRGYFYFAISSILILPRWLPDKAVADRRTQHSY